MDRITRIHLARVPYEIETNAQTGLKKYLDDIRDELEPDMAEEILNDIEVRITEILGDRGVKRNGVITAKDIAAITEQLGRPEQFTGDEPAGQRKSADKSAQKRLLRDTDNALLGGVASGVGAYLDVDPIIIRVIFLLLTLVSGLGILVYLALWIAMPKTVTSSDKLLMRGKKVTAQTLQQYRSTAQQTLASLRSRSILRFLLKALRLLLTAMAVATILGLLASTGIATAILYTEPLRALFTTYHLNYVLLGLAWLLAMTTIGALVIALIRLWGQRSAPLKIAFLSLGGIFLLALTGIASISPFEIGHYKDEYGGNNLTFAIPVNQTASAIPATSLDVAADANLVVSYVVTDQPVHATYQGYPEMGRPAISITNAGGAITLQASQLDKVAPSCVLNWCRKFYLPVRLTLYGPALQQATVNGGAELDMDNLNQPGLTLIAQNNSNLNLDSSYSDSLSLSAESGATITASDTTARVATINVQNDSSVNAPAVGTLNATMPASCNGPLLFLTQSPLTITLNGQPVDADTFNQSPCVSGND